MWCSIKVFKDKSFLVFDFEDGTTVKYDFATKTCIGKKGLEVRDLRRQLKGISMNDVCECCTDKNYAQFLRFVMTQYRSNTHKDIYNVGTILEKVMHYARFEQFFSAGIGNNISTSLSKKINDIPKGLITLARSHKYIKLNDAFVDNYKENPDGFLLPFKMSFMSLNQIDIIAILNTRHVQKKYYGEKSWQYDLECVCVYNCLIKKYKYNAKSLLNYLDYLKSFEAIDDINYLLRELLDYVYMMTAISNKFEKYPKNFLTTHRISCRNYNHFKQQFDELKFTERIKEDMEICIGDYMFIYPKSTQDMKDEAAQQSNCIASYIQRVIDEECDILFLRKKEDIDKSLVTLEVRNNQIVDAKQKYNMPVSEKQQEIINKWNKWRLKKYKKELKNAS